MRYLGGKSRIAKDIGGVIDDAISGRQVKDCNRNLRKNRGVKTGNILVSLFCGSCAVEAKCKNFDKIICNDNHKYLIAMLNAVKHGYELPDNISEEEYKYIRMHKDNDPALTGFVGFACSFGGKFFGGYAKDNKMNNYAARGKRSLLKDMSSLQRADFICGDYRDVEIPDGAVIYADPPYQNTTGYGTGMFDSNEFWQYMRELSKNHKVFISEQTAPSDFICIWEKSLMRILDVNKDNNFMVTEKLFTI